MYQPLTYIEDDLALTSRRQLISNGTLVIRNATESDHGHYLCHSDNGVGIPLSKVILLTVHSKYQYFSASTLLVTGGTFS